MALRPGRSTRTVKRPWTRVSQKKPRKSYVVGVPYARIHVFEMGNKNKKFNTTLYLVTQEPIQIRDNSMEGARISTNKLLENNIGTENYFMKILVYPHQVLREHALATGAGADRYSMGMRKAFGRPKGRAARLKANQKIIMLKLDKKNIEIGKQALKRADKKLSGTYKITIK